MSKDINSVIIVGRLVRNPDIRYTSSGTAVAKFSLAVGDRFKQGNDWKDYTNYFDVTVWGNKAVNCEKFLRKGSQVSIDGVLRQNRWKDQESNQTRSKVEIIANNVQFLTQQTNQCEVKPKDTTNKIIEDPWVLQWEDEGDGTWDSIPEF